MIGVNQFRAGVKVKIDGEPYVVVHAQHVKPGKGGAFVRSRLKNLRTGNVLDKTYRVGERFDEPEIEERQLQYLYAQGDDYHFMDNRTYEQLFLTADQLGENRRFIKENMNVVVMFYEDKPIGVDIQNFVELRVTETEPAVKGDTATAGTKPATLETGAVIKVPFHITVGDVLRIDTRTGSYVERAKG